MSQYGSTIYIKLKKSFFLASNELEEKRNVGRVKLLNDIAIGSFIPKSDKNFPKHCHHFITIFP